MTPFTPLSIVGVQRETENAISLTLAIAPHLADAFRFKPGQHLTVRATIGGEELRRTYSICSGPDEHFLRIAIKHIANGRFSGWANATLAPGMTLDAMPPSGRFILPDGDGTPRHLLAIAAGAGITPIMAMLQHALAREPFTRFTLIYGNRTAADTLFAETLEDIKDRHLGRLTLVNVYSREDTDTPLLSGRITPETLSAILAGIMAGETIAHAFLCGPGSMIRDLRQPLFDLGLPRDLVHHEFFAPPGTTASGTTAPTPPIHVAPTGEVIAVLDGVRHRLDMQPGETILAAALRRGLRAPYSCKAGMCCTCRARIVEGEAVMQVNYSLEPWEIERGFTLTCQAIPGPARLVIDYDQM